MTGIELLARQLVSNVAIHGMPRSGLGQLTKLVVRSVGTERTYRGLVAQYLNWLVDWRIPVDGVVHTRELLVEFLEYFSETHDQKQVNTAQRALSIVFGAKLPHVESLVQVMARDRAYSFGEVAAIARRQSPRNGLATLLAYDSGLRAHECLTIAPLESGKASAHRTWREERFAGREDVRIYLVTGKGGLTREVAVSSELASALESRRHPDPVLVRDREVDYLQWYAIGGGQAASASFTRASQLALGFSSGLHGARHSFARRRIDELCARFTPSEALETLSNELGHFRIDVTLVYLVGRHR